MKQFKHRKEQGLTLVELLVVIVIIGILAAIAIPVYVNQQKKAMITALKTDVLQAAQIVGTEAGGTPDAHTMINMDTAYWKNKISLSATTDHISIYAYTKDEGYLNQGTYHYCVAGNMNNGDSTIVSFNTIDETLKMGSCPLGTKHTHNGEEYSYADSAVNLT